MNSGRRYALWLLPLLFLVAGCDDSVTVVVEAEPEEVDTCEWLIPIGIELVNDYFYTLEQTDLGPIAVDPTALPESIIALNSRGAELDRRALELECSFEELNTAIVAATEGLESSDPVVNVFLDTMRSGIGSGESPYGGWLFVEGEQGGLPITPIQDRSVTLVINDEAASGKSGCNDYYFPLVISGPSWEWDQTRAATSTELMCVDDAGDPDAELAALEMRYLDVLSSVDSYEIEGDVLTLRGPDLELRYTRLIEADS